ncbi:KIAA1430-like protein-domain-containing protein [Gorgonomyces haynaldii]|nr:KIAA1430-like protein-domain-containing protein [Gorgonomyces haynaldii]
MSDCSFVDMSDDQGTAVEIPQEQPVEEKDSIVDPLTKIDPPTPEELEQPQMPLKKKELGYSHRHYQPIYPCCNKILAMKWDLSLRKAHRSKVAAARPTVDNSSPKPYLHLQLKLKKVQMEQDRLAQIERSNKILVEKMTYIMDMEAKDPAIHASPIIAISKHSRQREMAKIRSENAALLNRLVNTQPLYNHKAWVDDRAKNLVYLQNIASFPEKYIEKRKEYASLKGKQLPCKQDPEKAKSLFKSPFLEPMKKKKKKLAKEPIPAIPQEAVLVREDSSIKPVDLEPIATEPSQE